LRDVIRRALRREDRERQRIDTEPETNVVCTESEDGTYVMFRPEEAELAEGEVSIKGGSWMRTVPGAVYDLEVVA
jgi:hypothetical protein